MIPKPTSHSLSMITPVKSEVVTKSLPSCVNDASHLPSRETTIFCSGPRRTPSPSLCTPSSSTASTTASSTPSKTSTFPETVYCGSITAIQWGISSIRGSASFTALGFLKSAMQKSWFASVMQTKPFPQNAQSATLSSKHSFPRDRLGSIKFAWTS